MSTEKIIKDFKSLEELQEFAEAQYKTIIDLSKKNSKLEAQIKSLKEENKKSSNDTTTNSEIIITGSDEEIIARSELKKLREYSLLRDLTYEECKKASEYVKILQTVKANKPKESEVDNLKDADLLSIVNLLPNENKVN